MPGTDLGRTKRPGAASSLVRGPKALLALPAAIAAYRQHDGKPLDLADECMLDRLSKSREMAEAFATWALSGNKALLLIDACVEAHRLDTGEHEAQVERLRRFPDFKETQAKQAELESRVKDSGAWTENVRAAFDVIRTTLALHNDIREFNLRATSQKAVKAAARSRAIGRLKDLSAFCRGGRTFGT